MTATADKSIHACETLSYQNINPNNCPSQPRLADTWLPPSASIPHLTMYTAQVPLDVPSQPAPISYSSHFPTSSPSTVSNTAFCGIDLGTPNLLGPQQGTARFGLLPDRDYQNGASAFERMDTGDYGSQHYQALEYAHSLHHQQQKQQGSRQLSLSRDSETLNRTEPSFGELNASQGMLALSHQNLSEVTPRNIHDVQCSAESAASYGFPPPSSIHSSVSGPSPCDSFSLYSASTVSNDSATDYSSSASDPGYESVPSCQTLPPPSSPSIGGDPRPPAAKSMMSQFSSKVPTNAPKKHWCSVCTKRFTRPSSLQTHMYSHTGEKPFACSVEGCGRHFSVVSNLRRHHKVHQGEAASIQSDED